MGYIRDIESKLRTAIDSGEPTDNIVNWVKKTIYQSYLNGQKADKKSKSTKKRSM